MTFDELRRNAVRIVNHMDDPAKRCPDYDDECVDVPDHFTCWNGCTRVLNGEEYTTDRADGYCPFLIGQLPKEAKKP
jgi:hypothetical protein